MIFGIIVLLVGIGIFLLAAVTVNSPLAAVGIVLTLFGGFIMVVSPVMDPAYECTSYYPQDC